MSTQDDDEHTIFRQPRASMPRIESVWAFVSVDPEDDNEGICSMMWGGSLLPMIASDKTRVEQLKPIARDLKHYTGMRIKLVKFTVREEIEEI
jgi:hypothetical protein